MSSASAGQSVLMEMRNPAINMVDQYEWAKFSLSKQEAKVSKSATPSNAALTLYV